jgi:hypothetical protein
MPLRTVPIDRSREGSVLVDLLRTGEPCLPGAVGPHPPEVDEILARVEALRADHAIHPPRPGDQCAIVNKTDTSNESTTRYDNPKAM